MSGPKSANYYIAVEALVEDRKRDKQVEEQIETLKGNEQQYLLELKKQEDLYLEQRAKKLKEREQKATDRKTKMEQGFVKGEIEKIPEEYLEEDKSESDLAISDNFQELREYREKLLSDITQHINEHGTISESMESLLNEFNQAFSLDSMEEIATQVHSRIAQEAKEIKEQIKQEEIQRKKVDEAKVASIITESLKEMDYEVGTISETLFVEGGVTHFRDSTWADNYYVEMRIEPKDESMNFHMVYTGDTMHSRSDDQKTEDDWCGDFTHLQHSLGSKGISIEVTNHLRAGEIPVHTVTKDRVIIERTQKSDAETTIERKKRKEKRIDDE
ncbi:hypothetical protein GJV85_08715 [Sulfurimonas aquatica]|uniref:Uncharacterized protein n=1 Tax=Sulfurimonas aquatica TaxID=2672570 RepID=A0A975B130_9BACT|nr:hypothetical protein [Sulfurimonas aquatica]QSZ42190.1 hypothetical protein GJV85_08715 [Sulfurimonas aquatica]